MDDIPMITKDVLDQAKSFLCWDTFPDLSIQLIELEGAAAYFYSPSNGRSTILVFYRNTNPDFSHPLFLLFHEAGHCLQFDEWMNSGRESDFWKILDETGGSIKAKFERESWNWGRELLEDFIQKNNLIPSLLEEYNAFAEEKIKSYR
jgi:hypothetical protein